MSIWSTPKSPEHHAQQIRRNVDALINYKNGTVYLDFDREAESLEQAILTAIKDIESSKVGAKIVSVAPEHWVSLSDIAKRVSMTRQAVSLFIQGERGLGDFPKPVLKIANKSPLWRWSNVAEWFCQQGKIADHTIVDFANVIENMNAVLELRIVRDKKNHLEHQKKLLKELDMNTRKRAGACLHK